jgi:hypothetical protein
MTKPKPCPAAPGPLEGYAARFDDLFGVNTGGLPRIHAHLGVQVSAKFSLVISPMKMPGGARGRGRSPDSNILGTTWGPHDMHPAEQTARRARHTRTAYTL